MLKCHQITFFSRISARKVTFRRDICAYLQAVAVCLMSKWKLSYGPWAVFRGENVQFTPRPPKFLANAFSGTSLPSQEGDWISTPIRYGRPLLFSLHCSQRFHSRSPNIYFSCPLLLGNMTFSITPFAFFQGWDHIERWQAHSCDQCLRCLHMCEIGFNSPWTHRFPATVQSRLVCFLH